MKIQDWRIGALACAAIALAAGCTDDAEVTAPDTPSAGALALDGSTLDAALAASNPELAKQLAELKQLTAKYHNFEAATDPESGDYPILLVINDGDEIVEVGDLTSPDGCISDATAGGMGYHYLGPVAIDDVVDYRTPELLVYAPARGPAVIGENAARARLAAFDYFIPYSDTWPERGTAPTSADMGLSIDPPIEFAPSRFNGWMFHIWLWENNPAGLFRNWNSAVPLCADSPF